MTEEFKEVSIREIRKSFPLAGDGQVLEIAQIYWDLIPIIYNKDENDKK